MTNGKDDTRDMILADLEIHEMNEEFREDFNLGDPKPLKVEGDHPLIDRSRWGLFHDVDPASYHAGFIDDVTLSQSQMGRILDETPLDFAYNHVQLNPDIAEEVVKSTVQMRRGDVVHQLALGKGKGYFVLPDEYGDFKKKAAQELRDEAISRGETPILAAKFEEAEIMAEVIRDRIDEALGGAPYQTEVVFLYQEMTSAGPVWVRGMVDVWEPEQRIILDPKITAMLYNGKVERHLVSMGWDRQAALYPHAIGQIIGQPGKVRFADLMIKPEAPFTSRMVRLEKAWEHSAIKQCKFAIERFGRCLYAGRWPGFEDTAFVALPAWEDKRREAMELGGDEL